MICEVLISNWNTDQRKVIASRMVGLSKISLINIIINSKNSSILVFILVFKVSTEFPGKYVLVGEIGVKVKSSFQITLCLFSNPPFQRSRLTFSWKIVFFSVLCGIQTFGEKDEVHPPYYRLPGWQLWVVSLKTGKGSPLPHNSSFSSSAQMQAARWLFIKGRQPKVHTVLNTVSARESQATWKRLREI